MGLPFHMKHEHPEIYKRRSMSKEEIIFEKGVEHGKTKFNLRSFLIGVLVGFLFYFIYGAIIFLLMDKLSGIKIG